VGPGPALTLFGCASRIADGKARSSCPRPVHGWNAYRDPDQHSPGGGAATTRANGVCAIGVLWGYGSRAELEGAERVLERPGDLAGLLG
jgi:hypothetical protein